MITYICEHCETEIDLGDVCPCREQIPEFRIKIIKSDYGKFLNVYMHDGIVVMRIEKKCQTGYNLEIQEKATWHLPILASDHEVRS